MTTIEYNLNGLCIKTCRTDTYNELRARLDKLGSSFIICEEDGYGDNYFLLSVRQVGTDWTSHCGLCFGSSISPQFLQNPGKYCCWIGLDRSVFLFDFYKSEYVAKENLSIAFYEFVPLDNGKIIAVHELGAICLDQNGKKLWEIDGNDILKGYNLSENVLICSFEDGNELSHCI